MLCMEGIIRYVPYREEGALRNEYSELNSMVTTICG